jgi:predicted site-specific integrase-resolvase
MKPATRLLSRRIASAVSLMRSIEPRSSACLRPAIARAAIYARFSSDRQKDRSIDDQIALCRDLCAREWHGSDLDV